MYHRLPRCLKITENVSFNKATFTFWVDIKNSKKRSIWRVFENLKQSNGLTTNETFWVIFKRCVAKCILHYAKNIVCQTSTNRGWMQMPLPPYHSLLTTTNWSWHCNPVVKKERFSFPYFCRSVSQKCWWWCRVVKTENFVWLRMRKTSLCRICSLPSLF